MAAGGWDPNSRQQPLQEQLAPRLVPRRPAAASRNVGVDSSKRQVVSYRFIPYHLMSHAERRKFLPAPGNTKATATSAKRATRTAGEREGGSFWRSGSKPMKAFQFHAAELSREYRSSPELLKRQTRCVSAAAAPPEEALFFKIFASSRRQLPASAAAAAAAPAPAVSGGAASAPGRADAAVSCPSISRASSEKAAAAAAASAAAGSSVLSDYPSDTADVLHGSQSNRLLNVMSVDECHVKHRRRRRRIRKSGHQQQLQQDAEQKEGEEDGEEEEVEEDEEEVEDEEEFDFEREEQEEAAEAEAARNEQRQQQEQQQQQQLDQEQQQQQQLDQEQQQHQDQLEPEQNSPHLTTSDIGSNLSEQQDQVNTNQGQVDNENDNDDDDDDDSSSGGSLHLATSLGASQPTRLNKRRSEEAARRLAAARSLLRADILREKMAIFLDWKLHEDRRWRRSGGSAATVRSGTAAGKFRRFMSEMASRETDFASQFRVGADSEAEAGGADKDGKFLGDQLRDLSLTQMFDALK